MVGLGENLYLWRLFKGLCQEELAERARVPRPNLAAFESGRRVPSLSTLRSLALSLGTSAGALADGTAPVYFTGHLLSRKAQEGIVKASLGESVRGLTSQQKLIGSMLAGVIRNKVNAGKGRFSKETLRGRRVCVKDWLILKSAIEPHLLNKLLAQIDKRI